MRRDVFMGVVGVGVVATFAGIIRATKNDLNEILEEHREIRYIINNLHCPDMTKEENEKDRISSLRKLRKNTCKKLGKLYAFPAGVGMAALTMMALGLSKE